MSKFEQLTYKKIEVPYYSESKVIAIGRNNNMALLAFNENIFNTDIFDFENSYFNIKAILFNQDGE